MIRILTILILFILGSQTFAQVRQTQNRKKTDDLTLQIERLKYLLGVYDTLSPFSPNDQHFDLIDSVGTEITTRLLYILNDPRIQNYKIENLFTEDALTISKSRDNRVYFFSIDAKTGGSNRTSKTIIHYKLTNGTVKAEIFGGEESEELATSTYGQLFLLDSLKQKYFVIGGVQTCNTCIASVALTLQLDADSIVTELVAQYDGRYQDLVKFDFNNERKEFDFEYYAAANDDAFYGGDNEKSGSRHRYKSRFKYLNGAFAETEKGEFYDER